MRYLRLFSVVVSIPGLYVRILSSNCYHVYLLSHIIIDQVLMRWIYGDCLSP